MNNDELSKKFHDKKFLKSSDFHEGVASVLESLKDNKLYFVFALIVGLALIVAVPSFKLYRMKRVQAFNEKLHDTENGLKKEEGYKQLIQEYQDLSAHQYARIKLVDYYLENQDMPKALTEIDNGLKEDGSDIFSTLLVLKRVNLFKKGNKYKEASDFASAHESKIMESFKYSYKMIQADLCLLADDKAKAREIYQALTLLAASEEIQQEPNEKKVASDYDPQIVEKAKDQLFLLDLGVL